MKKIINSILVVSLGFVLISAGWSIELYAQVENQIKVTYSLTPPKISLHQPLILEFNVQNEMTEPINLKLGQDLKENFIFIVTWPNGTTVQLPGWRRDGLSLGGDITVPAESHLTERFVLNEWSDFSEIGKYMLEIKLTTPIQSESGAMLQNVQPYRTSFEILPRNEKMLTQLCEELTETIVVSQSAKVKLQAALMLSYVKDPIAVPYLERALISGNLTGSRMMNGLVKIGDWNAIKVLVSIIEKVDEKDLKNINSVEGNKAILASQALQKIGQNTSDLGLKQLIQQILKQIYG